MPEIRLRKDQGTPTNSDYTGYMGYLTSILERHIPLRHGLTLARELLGNSLPKESIDFIQDTIAKTDTTMQALVNRIQEVDGAHGVTSDGDKGLVTTLAEARELLGQS